MSLSLDFSGLLEQAGTLINGLFPLFIVPLGITLGMALLGRIFAEIRKAI